MPRNDSEFNQMLVTLYGGGLISKETGIEKNTISTPDEKMRLQRELEESIKNENRPLEQAEGTGSNNNTTNHNKTE